MNQAPNRKHTGRAPSLESSGKRREINPLRLTGHYSRIRKKIAWILLAVFFVTPWIEISGKPFIRLDVAHDSYWLFFQMWHQTDAIFFIAIPALLVLVLFLATALKGRIWCGYACPQTVFLDWMVRPIEEFFEGNAYNRIAASKRGRTNAEKLKKLAKHLVFASIAIIVGNVSIMYFYGPEAVLTWMTTSPVLHPFEFGLMSFIGAAFYFDFAWFREQFCSFLCPYARFQAILMDESSPSVHYDVNRGDPRGKSKTSGDCIDCNLCVRVCPTGIDIRNGLQLECIQCLRCVDACNSIMTSLGRKPELISYTSTGTNANHSKVFSRVTLYSILLVGLIITVAFGFANRRTVEIFITRQAGQPTASYGESTYANFFQVRLTNLSSDVVPISLTSPQNDINILCGNCNQPLKAFEVKRASLVVRFKEDIQSKEIPIKFRYGDHSQELTLPIIFNNNGD